ncbi:PREDICTED: protein PHYTOCHROME KINASE SUBSTRATE 4 [Tarenaya hassleriana]|uniref:protein PHYTOCHROME KINASE SUBSTRATE 4 n=1 Tax=Tarenaya hassleriana TaxID=28532 RepID=UPI00053C59C6|nr:PREDICTED: protein PHYTOCHROME KINASE SUBSTRATE 4 [Tarenaya hassleriana]
MAETSVTVVAKRLNGVSSVSTNPTLDPYVKFLQKSNNIDVSFSSYLKPDEKHREQEREEEEEEAELSIFDARKYFSETATGHCLKDSALNPPRFSSASSANVSSYSASFPAGHTASSEASWNSQTGLLAKLSRDSNRVSDKDQNRGTIKKGSSSGPRWLFRRRSCPCSSAKSVQVQENRSRTVETKPHSPDRILQVSVNPVSLTGSTPTRTMTGVHHQTISSSDPIRVTIPSNPVMIRGLKSIDDSARESRTSNGGFSFPILTPPSSEQTTKPVPNPTASPKVSKDEDAASDASSDLFEIESFSTSRPCAPRAGPGDSMDDSATEYGYEPSEASVTWSVTTAEPAVAVAVADAAAANLASLASGGCGKRRTAGNAFLSCRCEKAVMVSGGQRQVEGKSVGVPNAVAEKVQLSFVNRPILDMKSTSFRV